MSLSLALSAEQFRQRVYELFPKLMGRTFTSYRLNKRKNFEKLEVSTPKELKEQKYSGVVVVSTLDNLSTPDSEFCNKLLDCSSLGLRAKFRRTFVKIVFTLSITLFTVEGRLRPLKVAIITNLMKTFARF